MTGFGFGALALLVVVGMVGPLLGAIPRLGIPLVVGELAAGIVIGRTGFNLVDPDDPTFQLFANIGFALVMFVVGTHVPIRDTTLRTALPKAAVRVVAVAVVAGVLGLVLARAFGTGHGPLYAVLMASSSAALALPIIDSLGLTGPAVLSVTAQIAIADAAAIVLLPLVIDPDRASRAALGALAVAGCAALLFFILRYFEQNGRRKRLHHYSEEHREALELRISLILLFSLAALAIATHVSIMLAGFALGLAISAVGEPRRLARQLFGITEGFFGPLFFVWLGASLHVRELGERPQFIALGLALGAGAVLAHGVGLLLGMTVAFAVGATLAAVAMVSRRLSHVLTEGEPGA